MKVGETWKTKESVGGFFETNFKNAKVRIAQIFKNVDGVAFEYNGKRMGMPREMFVKGFEKIY